MGKKITCECGFEVSQGNISTHRKSEYHKNKMLELNKEDVVATGVPLELRRPPSVERDDAGDISSSTDICGEM